MLQNPCDPKNIKFPCDAVGLVRIGDYELFTYFSSNNNTIYCYGAVIVLKGEVRY